VGYLSAVHSSKVSKLAVNKHRVVSANLFTKTTEKLKVRQNEAQIVTISASLADIRKAKSDESDESTTKKNK